MPWYVMKLYAWIGAGSALGGTLRYACSLLILEQFGEALPWGTIFVNALGSFIIGLFATLTASDGRFLVSPTLRQFVMAGFCGGFTTFSLFSLQSLMFLRDGNWSGVMANIGLSLACCLVAVWIGHVIGAAVNRLKGSRA